MYDDENGDGDGEETEDAIVVTRMPTRGFVDGLAIKTPTYWGDDEKELLYDLVTDAVVKGKVGHDTFTKPRSVAVEGRYLHSGNIEDHIAFTMASSLLAKGALDKATALALGAIREEFSRSDIVVQDYDVRERKMTTRNAADFPMPKPRKPRAKKGA